MNALDLYGAFQAVDDDVLERSQTKTRNSAALKRIIATAACFLLILGMAVTVEASTGAVSNLLAPLFGMAQTELVDDIGVPVGVSATADGYTITAEAVIGDKYNVAVVYTISRDDGQPLPDNLSIDRWSNIGRTGGGSGEWIRNESNPSKISYVEKWEMANPIAGRYWSVTFSNLAISGEGDQRTVIAQGPWELSFTLRYKNTSQRISANKLRVSDEFGNEYQVNQIWISPIGIYVKGYQFDPENKHGASYLMAHFDVSLVMKDGTVIPLEDHSAGGHLIIGDSKAKVHFQALFDSPLDFETIYSLLICGTELKIDLS